MIAHLTGEVSSTGDRWVVIDVGGIGYLVQVTRPVLQELQAAEGAVRLYTHLAVREDGIALYGFTRQDELELFRILISVSSIGPQIAMNILSQISLEQFAVAIVSEDEKALTRVSGIGPKSAKRLILELKDRMKKQPIALPEEEPRQAASDAIGALISLGFTQRDAEDAVRAAVHEASDRDTQAIVRAALAHLRER
ncbi:MAG: Holliday junction branch migration protein RuvA [Methanomicrobiaceae archaeon]|uniref:Holliday junction dna helicase ruva n=1 Tax=hydrocarbon metagenome TaxID=938273 RepID=A0A0W8FJK8_9ZZZZ|nr:Holliday junction branch migration protein RuvA [Methanomicrobiaceae archaeon]MDD5419143.1 Holliday junction branch migration protein RuvA [Methanomicrobiaceae archaeon]